MGRRRRERYGMAVGRRRPMSIVGVIYTRVQGACSTSTASSSSDDDTVTQWRTHAQTSKHAGGPLTTTGRRQCSFRVDQYTCRVCTVVACRGVKHLCSLADSVLYTGDKAAPAAHDTPACPPLTASSTPALFHSNNFKLAEAPTALMRWHVFTFHGRTRSPYLYRCD